MGSPCQTGRRPQESWSQSVPRGRSGHLLRPWAPLLRLNTHPAHGSGTQTWVSQSVSGPPPEPGQETARPRGERTAAHHAAGRGLLSRLRTRRHQHRHQGTPLRAQTARQAHGAGRHRGPAGGQTAERAPVLPPERHGRHTPAPPCAPAALRTDGPCTPHAACPAARSAGGQIQSPGPLAVVRPPVFPNDPRGPGVHVLVTVTASFTPPHAAPHAPAVATPRGPRTPAAPTPPSCRAGGLPDSRERVTARDHIPSAGSRNCSSLRSMAGAGPCRAGGAGPAGEAGGSWPRLPGEAAAPGEVSMPSWKGGDGHLHGSVRASREVEGPGGSPALPGLVRTRGGGRGGSRPVAAGLALLCNKCQRGQQLGDNSAETSSHSGARTRYLARRSRSPRCGLRPRRALCGGWRHLP